jgi:hypothetical protein
MHKILPHALVPSKEQTSTHQTGQFAGTHHNHLIIWKSRLISTSFACFAVYECKSLTTRKGQS